MNKKVLILISILLIFFKVQAQEVLDKIVAIVDDNIILQSDIQQYAYSFAIQSGIDPAKEPG